MKNLTQSITKAQLIAEIEQFPDETPIILNIGTKYYPIETVITGSGNIYLESNIKRGRNPLEPEQKKQNRLETFRKANAKRKAKTAK